MKSASVVQIVVVYFQIKQNLQITLEDKIPWKVSAMNVLQNERYVSINWSSIKLDSNLNI